MSFFFLIIFFIFRDSHQVGRNQGREAIGNALHGHSFPYVRSWLADSGFPENLFHSSCFPAAGRSEERGVASLEIVCQGCAQMLAFVFRWFGASQPQLHSSGHSEQGALVAIPVTAEDSFLFLERARSVAGLGAAHL